MSPLQVLVLILLVSNGQSQDASGGKVAFQMFENFEANRETFISELAILKALKLYQSNLKIWKNHFQDLLSKFKNRKKDSELPISSEQLLHRLTHYEPIEEIKIFNSKAKEHVSKHLDKLPKEIDFNGAMKALIQLHLTYQMDPFQLTKGILQTGEGQVYQTGSGVSANDLGNLAIMSFEMNYFDLAINFLRSFIKAKPDQDVQELKKTMVSVHNNMVKKTKKKAGLDFRGKFPSLFKSKFKYDLI